MLLGCLGRKAYSAVKAVFLNWEDCNLDPEVRNETISLQTVFRDKYHFDAGNPEDIYQIPSKLSAAEVNAYISQAILSFSKLNTSNSKLMIVYYNGHGGVSKKGWRLTISG